MREDTYGISVIGIVAALYAVFSFMSMAHAAPNCPPSTVYSPRARRCLPDPQSRRPMRDRPTRTTGNDIEDREDRSAAQLVNTAMRGLDCGQAAEALRRLSNQVLALQATVPGAQPPSFPGNSRRRDDPRGIPTRVTRGNPNSRGPGDDEMRGRWRQQAQSPKFWKKVWDRMADAYRSCNRECFDDGVAIGTLSATAYCSASVALEGLPGPGYTEQPPLPVCETSIFTGCLKAYGQTASTTEGCAPYTQNQFASIFAEYESQDCHL